MINRPYQESSSTVSGSEIIRNNSKTSYNGTYGLNAQWTIYNGSKRLKTIEQEKLNNRAAELDVATSENDIEETITQTYVQILYAAESVKVNESTLALSQAQYERGKELFAARKHLQSRSGTTGSTGQYRPLSACYCTVQSARLQTAA